MDTITFASPILLRHLTFSEQRKMPIDEVNLSKVLEGLELTMDQVSGGILMSWTRTSKYLSTFIVYRLVYFAGMRLRRQYQGNWTASRYQPDQRAQVSRENHPCSAWKVARKCTSRLEIWWSKRTVPKTRCRWLHWHGGRKHGMEIGNSEMNSSFLV